MKILSLFDGMSCGRIALERAGIAVEKYYASEIDKYAIQVSKANYPDIVQLGDITKISRDTIADNIDMIIGGSPCQGFSFAGKQLNFNDPRSKLFFEYARLLKEFKPKYFLLENVMMKKEYNDVISGILGELYPECVSQGELFRTGRLEPIEINSALVSAQNRRRLYWTNISGVTQPEDKGIRLFDVLEKEVPEKYYIKNTNEIDFITAEERIKKKYTSFEDDKAITMRARQYKNWNGNYRVANIGKGGQSQRVYDPDGKSVTLSALGGGQGAKTGLYAVAQRGRNIVEGRRQDIKGSKTTQRMETALSEKMNTITSVQKDTLVLDINLNQYRIRRLTPVECERLQTAPDNYTSTVSDSQRYKMLGNGWTIDVIVYILNKIKAPG